MSTEHASARAYIDILHITDCHLSRHPDAALLGVNTRASLHAVLELIRDDAVRPDLLIASGDLAQDGSVEAYRYLEQCIAGWSCPKSWFPGNHDNRANMAQVVAASGALDKVRRIGRWQFVLLDSLVEGKVYGELSAADLELLERTLQSSPDLHTLVCLHHHPILIGSRWLDNIGLRNRDAFMAIVARHANVRALLWGHIHQQIDEQRGALGLYATPSTCIQFLPKSSGFAVENIGPGYRLLRLFDDGLIETSVRRATAFEFKLDMKSNGY
jgi:Icc protein